MAWMCVRGFARWSHRRPSKVFLPGMEQAFTSSLDVIDLGSMKDQETSSEKLKKRSHVSHKNRPPATPKAQKNSDIDLNTLDILTHDGKIPPPVNKTVSPRNLKTSLSKVFYEDGNFIFNRLPNEDAQMSTLLLKLKSKRDHGRCGLILVEGQRLIIEGLQANCKLKKLLFSRKNDLECLRKYMVKSEAEIFKMPYKDMEKWSNLETSPGMMGIFETPNSGSIKDLKQRLPIRIICDNIRDPGNLGSILRIALSVGCREVLLSKGCVNIWDPKVIRSASGAHFRLPLYPDLNWSQIAEKIGKNDSVFIADNDKEKSFVVSDSQSFYFANRSNIEGNADGKKSFEVPLIPYYDADYSNSQSISIIIGGETEGISMESYNLANERNGMRLNIPLLNGVDSLNTSMALAVIVFEMKKQLINARIDNEKESITA